MSLDRIKKVLNEEGDFGSFPKDDKYEKEFSEMLDYIGFNGAWKRKALEEYSENKGGMLIWIIGKLWAKIKETK